METQLDLVLICDHNNGRIVLTADNPKNTISWERCWGRLRSFPRQSKYLNEKYTWLGESYYER